MDIKCKKKKQMNMVLDLNIFDLLPVIVSTSQLFVPYAYPRRTHPVGADRNECQESPSAVSLFPFETS